MISKSHKRFSQFLNNSRTLESPEEFLGPNFEAVLNFWMILDESTKEQLITVERRYWDFYHNQHSEWDKVSNEVLRASVETIGREFAGNAGWAAGKFLGWAAYYTTRELIGMHKFFEQQKPLSFFPMFLKVL